MESLGYPEQDAPPGIECELRPYQAQVGIAQRIFESIYIYCVMIATVSQLTQLITFNFNIDLPF